MGRRVVSKKACLACRVSRMGECAGHRTIDFTGRRFTRLTALRFVGLVGRNMQVWRFACDCGTEKDLRLDRVLRGEVASCGCIRVGRGMSEHDAFWSRVDKSGDCWIWKGTKSGTQGYGLFKHGRIRIRAHRWAFEKSTGTTAPDGMMVCHRCDNPGCVRPDHLFLGTAADNTADMMAKGRHKTVPLPRHFGDDHWTRRMPGLLKRGENHHNAKLTEERVRRIRALRETGMTHKAIAEVVGCDKGSVGAILRGAAWSHVH